MYTICVGLQNIRSPKKCPKLFLLHPRYSTINMTAHLDRVVPNGEFGLWQWLFRGEPGVGEDLSCWPSLVRVDVEHPQDQVLGRGWHRVPVTPREWDLALPNTREDLLSRVLRSTGKGSGPTRRVNVHVHVYACTVTILCCFCQNWWNFTQQATNASHTSDSNYDTYMYM